MKKIIAIFLGFLMIFSTIVTIPVMAETEDRDIFKVTANDNESRIQPMPVYVEAKQYCFILACPQEMYVTRNINNYIYSGTLYFSHFNIPWYGCNGETCEAVYSGTLYPNN